VLEEEKGTGELSIEEQQNIMKRQPHLAVQDLENIKPSEITPLTPEVISRQATINIGTIGHVAHGKSTVVKAISGIQVYYLKLLKQALPIDSPVPRREDS
jgi:hypothetical protein